MLPVGSWLVWYWSEGALSALYEGLVVLPQRRLEYAAAAFPGPAHLLISGALGAIFCFGGSIVGRSSSAGITRSNVRWLAVVSSGLLLAIGCLSDRGRLVCFHAVRNLAPFVAGALLLAAASAGSVIARSRTFAVCSLLVMGAQVQFPLPLDSYFLYVVPLVFLGASLLFCSASTSRDSVLRPRGMGRMLAITLCLFAFLELKSVVPLGPVTGAPQSVSGIKMNLDRCGLTVERSLGEVYGRLIGEIHSRTESGEAILAGPDCPEVYFFVESPQSDSIVLRLFQAGSAARLFGVGFAG